MASLVLGIAGEAVGNALLGSGISIFGATLSGAAIGGAIGAFAGSEIDAALAPGTNVKRQGPRLSDINIQSSTEGAPIPRVFGRMRVAGQLIWATNFKETSSTTKTSTGGKGGGSSVTETDYAYSISFAVGLCAGKVAGIGRVWAGGNLIDLSPYTTRFYPGDETQTQDPLIQEIEGEGNTPAYRGLSYIVFEDMPLAAFGNRIPQLQFEIIRPISDTDPGALENVLPGVALIPGAGEFVYATDAVTDDDGAGATTPENAHSAAGVADIAASLDQLQSLAPNVSAASLVVGWFGSDLRCTDCTLKPGVAQIITVRAPANGPGSALITFSPGGGQVTVSWSGHPSRPPSPTPTPPTPTPTPTPTKTMTTTPPAPEPMPPPRTPPASPPASRPPESAPSGAGR